MGSCYQAISLAPRTKAREVAIKGWSRERTFRLGEGEKYTVVPFVVSRIGELVFDLVTTRSQAASLFWEQPVILFTGYMSSVNPFPGIILTVPISSVLFVFCL